jgi:hypothetical protein
LSHPEDEIDMTEIRPRDRLPLTTLNRFLQLIVNGRAPDRPLSDVEELAWDEIAAEVAAHPERTYFPLDE